MYAETCIMEETIFSLVFKFNEKYLEVRKQVPTRREREDFATSFVELLSNGCHFYSIANRRSYNSYKEKNFDVKFNTFYVSQTVHWTFCINSLQSTYILQSTYVKK